MNTVLFLSLVIILSSALPWWPNSAYGRSRHHRPRDKQLLAHETEVLDQRHEATQRAAMKLKALDRGPTPETSQPAPMKLCDGNSETHLLQGDVTPLREFEKRWAQFERASAVGAGQRP
jgi:hypothetical protein